MMSETANNENEYPRIVNYILYVLFNLILISLNLLSFLFLFLAGYYLLLYIRVFLLIKFIFINGFYEFANNWLLSKNLVVACLETSRVIIERVRRHVFFAPPKLLLTL